MSANESTTRPLSVLDSALILAMFSAVCYVMGNAARLGTARRLGLPLFLMPEVGPETLILVGGRYLVLFGAVGLLLYFAWVLLGRRIPLVKATMDPVWSGIGKRAHQHPRAYLLLACLASATIFYSVPLLAPLGPRLAGGPATFGGGPSSEVVALSLKEPDAAFAGRSFRYLWQHAGMVVLQDKESDELVVIREDEIRLMILSRPE